MTFEWCTYETRFSNSFFYFGKGKTKAVSSGAYTGSGIRYRLALIHWQDSLNSGELQATTGILGTYATEAEAYQAEEELVPLELLADPFCLNMHQGGLKGRYQTPSRLLQKINGVKKKEKKAASVAKSKATAAKLKELQRELKKRK